MASIRSCAISRTRDEERIAHALITAREHISAFDFGALETRTAGNGDPVTALDHRINDVAQAVRVRIHLLEYVPHRTLAHDRNCSDGSAPYFSQGFPDACTGTTVPS